MSVAKAARAATSRRRISEYRQKQRLCFQKTVKERPASERMEEKQTRKEWVFLVEQRRTKQVSQGEAKQTSEGSYACVLLNRGTYSQTQANASLCVFGRTPLLGADWSRTPCIPPLLIQVS